MKYKYLYEKKYNKDNIERKLFETSNDLFLYLAKQGERVFSNGFSSAEISLYRIEESGLNTNEKS